MNTQHQHQHQHQLLQMSRMRWKTPLAMALIMFTLVFTPATPTPAARRLMTCLNSHQPGRACSTWDGVLSDEMAAAVPVAGIWWSSRPPAVPVTILTQLTLDRAEQLYAQCRAWPGPISAVLYVALGCSAEEAAQQQRQRRRRKPGGGGAAAAGRAPQAALEAAIEQARLFHARTKDLACQLDLLLAFEQFQDSNASALLYPINILRNYARLQARTPLVGLFDADMLPSTSLFKQLQDPAAVDRLVMLTRGGGGGGGGGSAPAVLVLPAFVTRDANGYSAERIADRIVSTSKAVLATMWSNQVIQRFDPEDKGHNATQYDRWLTATQQYEVQYEVRYEPWVICDRLLVPWYDARFRGYGMNKIVHLEHLNHSGFRFVVHPSAWLVHRRHPLTQTKLQHLRDFNAMQATPSSSQYHTIYGHSHTLGLNIQHDIRGGAYQPVVDQPTVSCATRLPWWQQDHWQWQQWNQEQRYTRGGN